jgi:hypothetical protein
VQTVLRAWQAGDLGPEEVHLWAEDRYAASTFEPEDEIVNEVLAHLDILDINLTTLEDVPTFLRMLALPSEKTEEAIALLKEHGAALDLADRMRQYAQDPFYGRFCVVTADKLR